MSETNLEPKQEVKNEEVKNVENVGKNNNKKMFLYGFGGLILVVLVAILIAGSYRVYKMNATDVFTVGVAKTLGLSALSVNGQLISYANYSSDFQAISKMRDYDKAHNGAGATLTDEAMSDQVLFRLVNNSLVEQAAKELGVTIEDKNVKDVKDNVLLKQFKSEDDAQKAIMDRYGWDLNTYETKVIRPFVLQNKLAEKLQSDQATKDALKARAQTVLDQIKAGADFAAMAKQYGEDGTASKGGDLGFFAKGDMVPPFETAAFALKRGQLSPVLVETQYGYHIIRLDDIKYEKAKDENGKAITKETVRASHILFMFPTLEKYLNDKVTKAKIDLFIHVHDPFAQIKADAAVTASTTK